MQDISALDLTKMTEEELYGLNIYHAADDVHSEKQLHSLYGLVNEDQDREIIGAVHGKKVLDVGAGYGSLSRRLKEAGFEVTAIEPNPHTRELAKKWNHVDELPYSIYQTPFEDNYFDTVILRECVEHLNFPQATLEIYRICRTRVLVFQTNLNPLITMARKRIGHEEFNPQKLSYYRVILEKSGFPKQKVLFRDPLAFPLSGGYHTSQKVPHHLSIERFVVSFDKFLTRLLRVSGLAPRICWRYLLMADK